MNFIQSIHAGAQKKERTIVLPEGEDQRIQEAAARIEEKGIARVILLKPDEPRKNGNFNEYVELYHELRKKKGMTREKAEICMAHPLYYSAMLVRQGEAHGSVAGAANATSDVLRPALQIIGTAPGISCVSGAFLMLLDHPLVPDGMLVFADCAVHPSPDSRELAEIGVASAQTARDIAGLTPRVAFLSFSTKGSASHELVEKVTKAVDQAREMMPDIVFDGELQADAAIVPSVGEKKAPESSIAGKANVLVFPDLQSGNIAYKLVQRLAGAEAVGPILQGMASPVNDLSRGCSVDDIVNLVAITVLQTG